MGQSPNVDWGDVLRRLLTPAGLILVGLFFVFAAVFGQLPKVISTPISTGERVLAAYLGLILAVYGVVVVTGVPARRRRDLALVSLAALALFVTLVLFIHPVEDWVNANVVAVASGPGNGPTAGPVPENQAVGSKVLRPGEEGWLEAGIVRVCYDADAAAGKCSDTNPDRPFLDAGVFRAKSTPHDGSKQQLASDAPVYAATSDQVRSGTHGEFLGYVLSGSSVRILEHAGINTRFLYQDAYHYWVHVIALR